MMRRFFLSIMLVLSLLLGSFNNSLYAAEETAAKPAAPAYKVIILDNAKLLTEAEKQQLAQDMQPLTQYGNMIFSTVVLKQKNYEKHSEDTYYKLCGNEPGAIFQIDMGNRKLTLSTSGSMDEKVGPERDSIVDNIYQLATAKRYYECAKQCFDQIGIVYKDGEIAHEMKHINNGLLALLLGLIINFFIVFITTNHKVKKERILGDMATLTAVSMLSTALSRRSRVYDPKPKGSSGGSFGGRSGGGGGGGFSGGSSSHGF